MKNFIAFKFTDNDFHYELSTAIRYVMDNKTEELTLESWKELVVRGMGAFGMIKRIDNFSAKRAVTDHLKYIQKTLVVTEINNVSELDGSFEGYVLNKRLYQVNYHGY